VGPFSSADLAKTRRCGLPVVTIAGAGGFEGAPRKDERLGDVEHPPANVMTSANMTTLRRG